MRVPLDWLREYCDPALDVNGIEERLTMTGTKVEAIHRHGVGAVEHFVVGRVLSVEAHPDADRLRVCEVDLGAVNDEGPPGPVTIVCGAPNVAAGQAVAVARPGAVMPDGTKIKRAKLRGVPSEGMILAENELEIDSTPPPREGIMVLDEVLAGIELTPGTPLAEVLPIAVEVLDLEITPNRPDCLGVFGVARELHAATGAPLAQPPWSEDTGSEGPLGNGADGASADDGDGDGASAGGRAAGSALAEVSVECPDLCERFTARVFEDVTVAPSPPWLKARLMAAGQRPINNVVDITNYAMLLTGQPLHAFDLDHVVGARLTVRRAREGEQVDTLDGETRTLDEEMVVIADADGPTSIAGVKGGARSEVRPETKRVLLEVASWNGPNIHRTAWSLGLRSEASGRFEKGLPAEQCMYAQAVATGLLIECCGARVVSGTIDVGWSGTPPRVIRLREARVEAILGLPVSLARQAEILEALDFQTVPAVDPAAPERDGLDVTVPPLRRVDVTREVDLIEEVARIDGLEKLPATLPARRGAVGLLTHAQRVRRAAEDALVGRGLHEVIGWSFTDPGLLDRLRLPAGHAMRDVVRLENPLSEAQSTMRPTLLGSLLDAARHNVSRNGPDVAIFESGAVYRAGDARATHSLVDEHQALGALLTGALGGWASKSWRGEPGESDFFAAKALLGALLDKFHVDWSVQPATAWPFLHPGRAAEVLAGDGYGGSVSEPVLAETGMLAEGERPPASVGFVGEVHPLVAGQWDLERTAVFAIDLGKLAAAAAPVVAFKPFASVPSLRRDLAVTLPDPIAAAQVLERVREAGGEVLDDVSVFDVYTGPQVGEGMRSLALALSFRAPDRTLTEEDVEPARARIVAALGELGGELRV
ncbi:MAG TPA: phenylalanine--tRNA ligase subunit beta [Solirubrobacteraceae bacterium]